MANPFDVIIKLLKNEIILKVTIYYAISIALWIFFFLAMNKNGCKNGKSISTKDTSRQSIILCLATLCFLFFLLMSALNYVGYLPYGPDTRGYTYQLKCISINGRWVSSKYYTSYYRPYHTSAVFLSMFTQILGFVEVAYFLLLVAFLLSFVVFVGITSSKISGENIYLCLTIAALLFISTPNLGGFDLLQQYVSVTYSVMAISFIMPNRNKARIVCFLIFSMISIVTHLTSSVLSLVLLAAYLGNRNVNRAYGIDFLVFALMAVCYLFNFVDPRNIVLSLYHTLSGLIIGTVGEYTIRAYTEVPESNIFLFSWTLLPSIASAYLALRVIAKIRRVSTHHFRIFPENTIVDNIVVLVYIFSLGTVLLGVLTGASLYLVRYFANPSYAMLLFINSIILGKTFKIKCKKIMFITLFILFIMPYVYSAIYSEYRSPWMGEPRLASATRTDRIEMLMLARFGVDGYAVYLWHDAYVPLEAVEQEPNFIWPSYEYYPVHEVLVQVTKGETVSITHNSYLVPLKGLMTATGYSTYNVVYDGHQHVILTPK